MLYKTAYDYVKKLQYKKYVYFMWRNGLKNRDTDYSQFTKEEFIERFLKGKELVYRNLQMWEQSDEYNSLKQMLLLEQMNKDLYQIYDAVKEKAITGDTQAIKTFIMLQKEISKNVKNIKDPKAEPEQDSNNDDGLVI